MLDPLTWQLLIPIHVNVADALILARQFNFFKRYRARALQSDTRRTALFTKLINEPTGYLQHYLDLLEKYESAEQIYKEAAEEVRTKLITFADNGHSKYKIYRDMNPNLQQSPFINNLHGLSGDIIRFRLGSHVLPIETGRWSRTGRNERLCRSCNVLGDEIHALFTCNTIDLDLLQLPNTISEIWEAEDIFELFKKLKEANFLG